MKVIMMFVKQLLRKTSFYKPVRKIWRRLKGVPSHPLQNMPTQSGLNIVHLGSGSCGWSFVDNGNLHGCTIISAGLGEDASFDIEFASEFGARVILVDPTPRAIEHFNEILQNLGNEKSQNYSNDGKQPIKAYDLSKIDAKNFILVKKALWKENTKLKFFEPANTSHVSHSIINYQQEYKNNTPFIEVEAVTLPSLLDELGIEADRIPLIKLDIEGAEIEVLTHCMSQSIRPKQILVELDELNSPSAKGYERVDQLHETLIQNGYVMVRTDGQADFLYLRKD